MSKTSQSQFIKYVQMHERRWGNQQYRGRPEMRDILGSPVVVFWKSGHNSDKSFTVTLHDDLSDIESLFVKSMISGNIGPEIKKIAKIFKHHKRIAISGVSIDFVEVEDD